MGKVEINGKTIIEIKKPISDEQAKKEYLEKWNNPDRIVGRSAGKPTSYKRESTKPKNMPQYELIGTNYNDDEKNIKLPEYLVKISMDETICIKVKARTAKKAEEIAWDRFKKTLHKYKFKIKGGRPIK